MYLHYDIQLLRIRDEPKMHNRKLNADSINTLTNRGFIIIHRATAGSLRRLKSTTLGVKLTGSNYNNDIY